MMANYMIVRQRVTDLTRFQTTFDRLKLDREAAGLTELGKFWRLTILMVIVVMEVEDISRAKEYWRSDLGSLLHDVVRSRSFTRRMMSYTTMRWC